MRVGTIHGALCPGARPGDGRGCGSSASLAPRTACRRASTIHAHVTHPQGGSYLAPGGLLCVTHNGTLCLPTGVQISVRLRWSAHNPLVDTCACAHTRAKRLSGYTVWGGHARENPLSSERAVRRGERAPPPAAQPSDRLLRLRLRRRPAHYPPSRCTSRCVALLQLTGSGLGG